MNIEIEEDEVVVISMAEKYMKYRESMTKANKKYDELS